MTRDRVLTVSSRGGYIFLPADLCAAAGFQRRDLLGCDLSTAGQALVVVFLDNFDHRNAIGFVVKRDHSATLPRAANQHLSVRAGDQLTVTIQRRRLRIRARRGARKEVRQL